MKQNTEIISEIISVFCFTGNHVWNWNQIISAAEEVLKLFQFNIISATVNVLENIRELQQAREIILN